MKIDPFEKKFNKKCVVCQKVINTDQYGNGECFNCGWYNNELGEENENKVVFPNSVSLNKAKKLFKDKEEIKPNFDDFVQMFLFFGEVEFEYKSKSYVMTRSNNDGKIEYGCCPEDVCYFNSIDEFKENSKTFDGKFLKDVWNNVENPKYM